MPLVQDCGFKEGVGDRRAPWIWPTGTRVLRPQLDTPQLKRLHEVSDRNRDATEHQAQNRTPFEHAHFVLTIENGTLDTAKAVAPGTRATISGSVAVRKQGAFPDFSADARRIPGRSDG